MIIKIKNLRAETTLGVYAEEKLAKQAVLVNLEIDFNEGIAAKTDNVKDTLNYHPLADSIKALIENNRFELVEKMVEDIGQLIISHDKVLSCRVEVDKIEGPMKYIESFSVSKTFKRSSGWFPMI